MAWPFSVTSRWAAESTDTRMIACTRLILALAALGITFSGASGHDIGFSPVRAALVVYTLYSSCLYILALRRSPIVSSAEVWSNWVDVGWYTLLFSVSSGMNGIFFPGLFFPVILASFKRGYA